MEAILKKREGKNYIICKVINKEISGGDLSVKTFFDNESNKVETGKIEKTNDENGLEMSNKENEIRLNNRLFK